MSGQLDAYPAYLQQLLDGNGRGAAFPQGGHEGRGAGPLALVLSPQVLPPEGGPAEAGEGSEVVELQHPAGGKTSSRSLGKVLEPLAK